MWLTSLKADLIDAFSRRNIIQNAAWILLLAAFNIVWPIAAKALGDVPLAYALPLGVAGFFVLVALLLLYQRSSLVITSGMYGIPGKEVDVKRQLNRLIVDDVLDFYVRSEVLGVDPVPGVSKMLRVRWTYRGKPDGSSYLETTHVIIPREAARQPDESSDGRSRDVPSRDAVLTYMLEEQAHGNELREKARVSSKHGGLAATCDAFVEWGRGVDERVRVDAPEYYPELLRTTAPWSLFGKQKVLLAMDHRLAAHSDVIKALKADAVR